MKVLAQRLILVAVLLAISPTLAPAQGRSVGQFIDDTTITTEIKAKLTADKLSNLTKIEVKTDQAVVTLNGSVDSAERAVRAEQIASNVHGVRGIVNNLHVTGTTVGPAAFPPGAAAPFVDATGVVAQVDPASGTITLQDGRVVRLTPGSVIWQPGTLQSVRPGAQVLVRGAAPVAVAPTSPSGPEWRMGTVRTVDRSTYQLVLDDGTVVRLAPTAVLRRGRDRVGIEQVVPGTEVVIRTAPPARVGSAEGSAFPRVATAPVIEASEVEVMWMPTSAGVR